MKVRKKESQKRREGVRGERIRETNSGREQRMEGEREGERKRKR